jgi:hypothetical protein
MSAGTGLVITLVHGTWGRGIFPRIRTVFPLAPCWFERGSAFRTRLEATLEPHAPVVVREFNWSGSNSLAARQKAAKGLASDLSAAKDQFPAATHVLIGHSHGGNIALAALCDMQQKADGLLFISLATPFLLIRRVPADAPIMRQISYFFKSALILLGLLAVGLLESANTPGALRQYSIVILTTSIGAILTRALVFGFRHPLMDSVHTDFNVRTRALVIRSVDDEAALALVASSIVSRLSYFLLALIYLISRAARVVAVSMAVIGFVILITSLIGYLIGDSVIGDVRGGFSLFRAFIEVALIIYCLAMLFMVPLLAMIAVGRSFIGRELIFGGILREVSVQSVPDSDSGIEVRTLPTEFKRAALRHSIYGNSHCALEIAKWITITRELRELGAAGDRPHATPIR